MRSIRSALPVMLGLASATPLAAQQPDFTIHVPVQIEDLHPGVVEIGVRCLVYDNGLQFTFGEDLPRGSWVSSDRVPVSGSAFNGTLTVELSFPEYSVARKRGANGYSCEVQFGNGSSFAVPSANASEEWLVLTDGSERIGGQFAPG